jgi:hypothetical protein
MEVWTFVHKETKEIIRVYNIENYDDVFGNRYYFTDGEYATPWFVFSKEEIDFIIKNKKFIHGQYSVFYNMPSVECVNIDDYDIIKFEVLNEKI